MPDADSTDFQGVTYSWAVRACEMRGLALCPPAMLDLCSQGNVCNYNYIMLWTRPDLDRPLTGYPTDAAAYAPALADADLGQDPPRFALQHISP